MSTEVEFSYSNVFKDLNLQDADDIQIKAPLACVINRELTKRNLSPADSAKLLGITESEVSELHEFHLEDFSIEQLIQLLAQMSDATI